MCWQWGVRLAYTIAIGHLSEWACGLTQANCVFLWDFISQFSGRWEVLACWVTELGRVEL